MGLGFRGVFFMVREGCCPGIPLPRRASVWGALAGGVAFGLIAADVVYHGQLQRMDMPVARWVAEHRPTMTSGPHPLVGIGAFVTDLGSTPVIVGLSVIVAIWLAVYGKWRMLAWGAVAMIGEPVINMMLKPAFGLPRPTMETSAFPLNHGYTFPSGHAMAACVAFGILAMMVSALRPRMRVWAWVGWGVISAAVGAALVYIGVHYVTDVLAAYAVSVCWLGVMARVPWAPRVACAAA